MAESLCFADHLYWPGNAAKTRIIRDIARRSAGLSQVKIFDYGCGDALHWRSILETCPHFALVAYDISPRARHAAREHLAGLKAEIVERVEEVHYADYIVSFSVLEHVYDRKEYLMIAKQVLAPKGIFYLNYDDGHFRICLDLSYPANWGVALRSHIHNMLAPLLARFGYRRGFQQRVKKRRLGILLQEIGFEVCEEMYENLGCIKGLYKHVSQDKRKDFMDAWVSFERLLNNRFRVKAGKPYAGDDVNLWQFMGSRTLVLSHREKKNEQ